MKTIVCVLMIALFSCGQGNENKLAATEEVQSFQQQVEWRAGDKVSLAEAESIMQSEAFRPVAIPDGVFARMRGKSFPDGPSQVKREDLCYIRMLHYTLEGQIRKGEMVVAKSIAEDVADVFRELYEARYPIDRIQLIDDFDAKDENSMRHNNSSAFCYRAIAGSTRLSKHALGRAVDINPLYNPYFHVVRNEQGDSIGYRSLQPATAADFVRRSNDFPYKLDAQDLAVQLFKKHGFTWGGDWNDPKDYQHFEK